VVGGVLLSFVVLTALLLIPGLILVHAGLFAGVRAWDTDVSRWVVDHRTAGLDNLVPNAGRIADTVPVVVVALVVEAFLVLRRRWTDLLVLVIGLTLELSVFLTVNAIVARPRPDVAKLGDEPGTHSYPSGHVAATFVLWGAIAVLVTLASRSTSTPRQRVWWHWLPWAAVVLITSMVAFSRIYRGMHHLTDVVAGLVLGVGALAVAVMIPRWVDRSGPDPVRGPVHDEPAEVAA